MPFAKIWIHCVWSTKNRQPILTYPVRNLLFDHIRKNAGLKQIHIDRMNGHLDHVHCLLLLRPTQPIGEIIKLIKGESAHWFNNQSGIKNIKLQWQSEYFAVSVSESIVPKLRMYIDGQEVHHQKKTFGEEYNEFMKCYDFSVDEQPRD